MKHATDEDLLTLHWEGTRRTAAHTASCPECAARLAELRSLLRRIEELPVPERSEEYGRQVWARIAPRLPASPASRSAWLRFLAPRPLLFAGGLTALVMAAFLAGRAGARRSAVPSPAARDRVLLIAVGEHLERSQAVLLELVHGPGDGGLDVSSEQARLTDLLPANRLYRQAASSRGEPGVSAVLDELERILLDVRHGPSRLSPAERAALARRIDADGVLFKVRVLGTRLRDRAAAAPYEAAPERKRI